MNDAPTRPADAATHHRLAATLQSLLIVGMVLAGIAALAAIVSPSGLALFGDDPDTAAITGQATVDFDVDFGQRLDWTETDDGTVDAATGEGRAAIGAPVTAEFSLFDPTASERWIWTLARLTGPLVAFGGLWLVLGIVRSTRAGHPFTRENERRLWHLAMLVAIGGTVVALGTDVARNFVLQRSAAADIFKIEATVSFLPIMLGITIAVLAGVWRIGVDMSDDLAGTI